MKKLCFALSFLVAGSFSAMAEERASIERPRFDPGKFHIGAYYVQPQVKSEEAVRDIAACGIDDPHDCGGRDHTLTFRMAAKQVRAFSGSGEKPVRAQTDGEWSLALRSNESALIISK